MPTSNLLRRLLVLGLISLLAACAGSPVAPGGSEYAPEPDEADDVTTTRSGVKFTMVTESYVSAIMPEHNLDSPASWTTPDGDVWVVASAKASDQILVYDGDSGVFMREFGGTGDRLGRFSRPNGVFVIDDLLFVVERDNRRVQVLRLPIFTPLGSFGSDELKKPYGLWVRKMGEGYEVLVTDAFMSEADEDVAPPLADLGRRFQRYKVMIEGQALSAESLGAFGDTSEAGAIRIPESISGDEANGRLLISEEDQGVGTRLRVYGMDYVYTGRDVGAGLFKAQAEGMALWSCADGSGYWIATDQYKDRSVFHVFDRQTLEPLGAFAGRTTANTDGVWLHQAPTRFFPQGVFFAVHDDQAISAFNWREIAKALNLREACAASQ